MPPSTLRNRMLLLVVGTGVATGLHLGLLHLVLLRAWLAPVTFVVGSLVFSLVTYALWRWVLPRLGGRSAAAQLLRQAVVTLAVLATVSVTVVAVATMASEGTSGLFGAPVGPDLHLTVTAAMRQQVTRAYVLLPIIPVALMTLIGYHLVWRHLQDMQTRERQLTELAATAQLAALRAQINPHFLFNSLNSIAQLIHTDPDKAEVCVERLAEMLPLHAPSRRPRLRAARRGAADGDRLSGHRARPLRRPPARRDPSGPAEPAALIPNLILQPLVENAVKHGLSRKLGPGTVSIDAAVHGDLLTLTVGDDGPGMTAPMLGEVWQRGVGLRNLRERLERLYGPEHTPVIESTPGRGTVIRLSLPPQVAA